MLYFAVLLVRSDHPATVLPLSERPFKLLVVDRVREGPQWEQRKVVHQLCLRNRETCVTVEGSVSSRQVTGEALYNSAKMLANYYF